MYYKIKFRFYQMLFRLFAYLADKTGGWKMFVLPKLLFGSIIIGLGVTAYGQDTVKPQVVQDTLNSKQDSIQHNPAIFCYHVEVMPEFPGGDKALLKWLIENVHYPKEAKEKGIQGRITCRFLIDENGNISDVEIVKGLDSDLDAEAIRVIESMPKWIPGTQNGKTVRVYYSLPVTFKLPQ